MLWMGLPLTTVSSHSGQMEGRVVLVCAGIDISSGFNQQAGQMDVGVRAGYVECSQSLRVTLVDAHSQLHKQLD